MKREKGGMYMKQLRWISLCLLIVGGIGLTWLFFNGKLADMLTLTKIFCGVTGAGLLGNLVFCLWRLEREWEKKK